MGGGASSCSKCGADIVWAVTNKGRRMPVDPEPRPDGNLALYRDHLGQLRVRVVSADHTIETYERPGMAHFATCPGPGGGEPLKRTRDGVVLLSDARRRRANAARRKP